LSRAVFLRGGGLFLSSERAENRVSTAGLFRRRVTLICAGCAGKPVPSRMTVLRREVPHSSSAGLTCVDQPHSDIAGSQDRPRRHPPGPDAVQRPADSPRRSCDQLPGRSVGCSARCGGAGTSCSPLGTPARVAAGTCSAGVGSAPGPFGRLRGNDSDHALLPRPRSVDGQASAGRRAAVRPACGVSMIGLDPVTAADRDQRRRSFACARPIQHGLYSTWPDPFVVCGSDVERRQPAKAVLRHPAVIATNTCR